MTEPAMPIWEERRVEVTAASAVAVTWANEMSLNIPLSFLPSPLSFPSPPWPYGLWEEMFCVAWTP